MTFSRVLVTGSKGLIGSALIQRLRRRADLCVSGIDLRETGDWRGDIRDAQRLDAALEDIDGIVHLAAVSRVVWAQRDPKTCEDTNVTPLSRMLEALQVGTKRPWLIFASSREVYGQQDTLPVAEGAPLRPMNVYGNSKVAGERLVEAARARGLTAGIVRFSNVYGRVEDHADRVIPAFVRAAIGGEALRLEGTENTFDFTHVDDVAAGLEAVIDLVLRTGSLPDPLHFVSGRGTTLGELAELAIASARRLVSTPGHTVVAPPRNFDVARFRGDPSRTRELLGWQARTTLEDGLDRLARDVVALREGATA